MLNLINKSTLPTLQARFFISLSCREQTTPVKKEKKNQGQVKTRGKIMSVSLHSA